MSKLEICVLFGGMSSEHEVSLASAHTVLGAIDEKKYIVRKIGITRGGEWYLFEGSISEILEDKWHKSDKKVPICVDFLEKCLVCGDKKIRPSVAFPVMHGEYGEDGRVQSLFELLGIKCVGADSRCASLCMDKYLCKCVATRERIPVTPYITVKKGHYEINELLCKIGESICDLFVKPSLGGSSVGISHIHSEGELAGALERALKYSDTVLIEEAIKGSECEVAILEREGECVVSEVGQICYEADFYDYQTKYFSSSVKYKIPASISLKCAEECRDFAKRLFLALGCRGMSRFDFFVCENGQIYFNEVNAIPGFTGGSMYPMLLRAQGYELEVLIDALIASAI